MVPVHKITQTFNLIVSDDQNAKDDIKQVGRKKHPPPPTSPPYQRASRTNVEDPNDYLPVLHIEDPGAGSPTEHGLLLGTSGQSQHQIPHTLNPPTRGMKTVTRPQPTSLATTIRGEPATLSELGKAHIVPELLQRPRDAPRESSGCRPALGLSPIGRRIAQSPFRLSLAPSFLPHDPHAQAPNGWVPSAPPCPVKTARMSIQCYHSPSRNTYITSHPSSPTDGMYTFTVGPRKEYPER
ncbi:hypothetical protein AHF37_02539 [Paragonimus kellicotti]|nr:hypothetical protein AHF37_02539 [Paragonimus kellicotti]